MDAPGQEAAIHGVRIRPVERMELRDEPAMASAAMGIASGPAEVRRRSQSPLSPRERAARGGFRLHGLRVDRLPQLRRQRALLSAAGEESGRLSDGLLQLHAGPAARLPLRRAGTTLVSGSI